jgi:hypothetical protein
VRKRDVAHVDEADEAARHSGATNPGLITTSRQRDCASCIVHASRSATVLEKE